MNLNDFKLLPNKPKSVRLNVRNLRELRMETVQLDQENKNMEIRLQQLREAMSREKQEREKCGALRWKSAQIPNGLKNKATKAESIATGKTKIRLLKDEPLPVQRVPEPPPNDGRGRKFKLKGKVCGQCEVRTAGLVCAECGEDYCVGCFARFHQKGALKFHHMIPIQAELHTSISSVDVRNRIQKNEEMEEDGERSESSKHNTDGKLDTQVVLVNDGDVMEDEDDQEPEESLLRGRFDEEESSRSFQQALMQWRNSHGEKRHQSDCMVQTPRPVTMEVMGTQAEGRPPTIQIEFRDHGLSYMEKLLLKKHRRTPIESYRLLSVPSSPQDPNVYPSKQPNEDNHQLTAEELDLHRYCVSLFSIPDSAGSEEPNYTPKSHLSISEIDETAADSAEETSSGVTQRDDNEKKFNHARKRESATSRVEQNSVDLPERAFTSEARLNQFSPSPLPNQNLKKSEDTLVTGSSPRSDDLLKSQMTQRSQGFENSIQDWDSVVSASFQSQNRMHPTPIQCRSPVSPVPASTPSRHLHSSATALDISSQEEVNRTTKLLSFSHSIHTEDNEAVLCQVSSSLRLDDLIQSQTSQSSSNATSTPEYSNLTLGDYSPTLKSSLSMSNMCQSPAFPVSSEPNVSPAPSEQHTKGYTDLHLPLSVPSTPKEIPESQSQMGPMSILGQSPEFLDSSGLTAVKPVVLVPSQAEQEFGCSKMSLDFSLCPTPAREVMIGQVSPSPRLQTPRESQPKETQGDQSLGSSQIGSTPANEGMPSQVTPSIRLQTSKGSCLPTRGSDYFPAPSPSQAQSSLHVPSQCHSALIPVSSVADLPEQHHRSYKALETPSSLQLSQTESLDFLQKGPTPTNEEMTGQVPPSRLDEFFEPQTQIPSPQPTAVSATFPDLPPELESTSSRDLNLKSYAFFSELQKCPASTEELSSEDEDPKEQINLSGSHISPHLSSPDSDMSSESMGLMPSDNEGSSDEDTRYATLQAMEQIQRRSISSSQRSFSEDSLLSPSCRSTENSGLFTEPSTTLRSLAQRHSSVSSHYQGLDGFLMLGVDGESSPLNPALSLTPSETLTQPTHPESFIAGNASWTPATSLRHHVEAELVNAAINNPPISISGTPTHKTEQPRSLNASDFSGPQSTCHSVSVSPPVSQKVWTVERADPALSDQDDEEEEDELALMSLEEELRRMSAKPGQPKSHRQEVIRRWEDDDSDF